MKIIVIAAFAVSLISTNQVSAQQTSLNDEVEFASRKDQQPKKSTFKVTNASYHVTDDKLLRILKTNESNSYISVDKIIDTNTLVKERNRIFKLLSPAQLQLSMEDIVFNVDTTAQTGSCTIVTVVKPIDN